MSKRARVATATIVGVEAVPVDVEIDIGPGLPSFAIVGLGDAAVQEARERVRSAVRAAGFDLPNSRIVVNLAPAPLRKHGTGFDLPIAVALLVATEQIDGGLVADAMVVGELSLDGAVRGVPGEMAYAMAAARRRVRLVGASETACAGEVSELDFRPLIRLGDLRAGLPPRSPTGSQAAEIGDSVDFSDVVGQGLAIRALTVAAAGGHSVLMIGPPGSGKTMLARRLPTILAPLAGSERLESALVHSVAGLSPAAALGGLRPFRAPHHSASIAGMIGGGSPPRPGEVSLAHNGVLFLDEMPEFGPATLQCLRQPLEDGVVAVVRAEGRVVYPACFALVGAANPCPCGYLGDPARACTCPPSAVERYRARIGGPLMDRIDMVVGVDRPDPAMLLTPVAGRSSAALRQQALAARAIAVKRDGVVSARLSGAELLRAAALNRRASRLLEVTARLHSLSGRGVTRLLRVARTIADLEGDVCVGEDHLAEAIGYRVSGRT